VADRHREIGKRQQARQRVLDGRAASRKYTAECVERRHRRAAAFLLSDALDLADEIPVPGALTRTADKQYVAAMEGVEYTVNIDTGVIRFRTDSKGIWEGNLQNPELRPIHIDWEDPS
jgi:hypothetical protein